MKVYLLTLLTVCLLALSFWGGLATGEKVWSHTVADAVKHQRLSDLRGCLFSIDSEVMHFLNKPEVEAIKKLLWREEQCSLFLDFLGRAELDEETSVILGEARLFYGGYSLTFREVIGREIQLQTLYTGLDSTDVIAMRKIVELEEQQEQQIQELQKFLDRLESLIVKAW